MTDRPILFSGPMVRALLEGRKTQTRRVLPQPNTGGIIPTVFCDLVTFGDDTLCFKWREEGTTQIVECGARYVPSDRLWVREDWKADSQLDHIPPRDLSRHEPRLYLADKTLIEPTAMMIKPGKHRQAMHMPRWASRLTLTVTDVRVQRVQEISEADALAEGVEFDGAGYQDYRHPDNPNSGFGGVRGAYYSFESLWDSLNDARGFGWEANPWVAAYTFTVERRNIDT